MAAPYNAHTTYGGETVYGGAAGIPRTPYIPPPAIDGTVFPQPYISDLATTIRLIEERWRRSFPVISYRQMDKRTTAVNVADTSYGASYQDGASVTYGGQGAVIDTGVSSDALSGEVGSTKFDPLWGESIDPNLTEWTQPHGKANETTPVVAVEPTVYLDPVPIHARIRRSARKDELQKLGFDRVRDLIVTIPASLLDASGITCQAGDRFVWNNELYEVLQWSPTGWYYSTSVKLYVSLNVQHARRGS